MTTLKRLSLLSILVTWAIATAALPAAGERLPIRVYTTADGLAHDRINRIVRDSHGFLWFCTPGGLSRFDGTRFITYRQEDGLSIDSVNDIIEDGTGAYWIATNGAGVARLDPRAVSLDTADDKSARRPLRFHGITLTDDPAANRVNVLHLDGQGRLWAGTDGGLFVMNGTAFVRVPLHVPDRPDVALQIWAMLAASRDAMWIGTAHGLVRRDNTGRAEWFPVAPSGGTDHVLAMLQDGPDRMWIGHQNGLLALDMTAGATQAAYEGREVTPPRQLDELGQIRRFTTEEGLAGNRVYALHRTAEGRLWAAGTRGITAVDDSRLNPYRELSGVPGHLAQTLAEDIAGNLWTGTSAGAVRVARHGFTTFDENDGLSEAAVGTILETSARELCAITGDLFINVFDGTRFHAIKPNLPATAFEALPPGSGGVALQARSAEWWIAVGDSLFRFHPVEDVREMVRTRVKRTYTPQDHLAGGPITGLFEDSRGDIWIGSTSARRAGITRWDRASETFVHYAEGLPLLNPIASIIEDHDRRVWLGFRNGGMARFDGRRFRFFPEPSSTQWHDYRLLADRAGRVWISTGAGNELRRIDNPSADIPLIRPYRTWTAPERGIVLLIDDERGRIYLRTTRGVARLDPETGRTRRYTTADGLAHLEAQAAYRDRSGVLWFATREGLSRLVPETDEPESPPAVAIGAVRIAGNVYPLSELGQVEVDRLVIRPDERQLDIEYFAISFQAGDVVRYQVKLEGADGDWNAPTTTPAVTYAYLRPGRYRFLVRAVTARGTTSDRPATIAFTVLAPVWQRWWFLALAVAAVAAGVHTFYRVRLNRLLELERIRTRIASDLHDDIGSGLSRLAILSEVAQRKLPLAESEPVRLLAEMSNTARNLIDAMGDIVWAIAPRDEDLGSVIARVNAFAAEVLERQGITYDFHVSPEVEGQQLSPDQRRHLLLILKEGITNIARHSGCQQASLTVSLARGSLRVLLADDGRGFVPGVMKGRGGHGLRSMHNRAAAVRGRLEISGVEGNGTRILLVMPLT